MSDLFRGTKATKEFYEQMGWHKKDGVLVDSVLFTPRHVGPIQKSMIECRKAAIRELIGGPGLRLLECGSGARPALFLASRCDNFTAVDFSSVGLIEAAAKLESTGLTYRTVEADITQLPFSDGEFDVAYSAHAIYHIATPDGQSSALAEMMRVVRPGGRVVLVLANPFPLLFPGRLLRRLLAATPMIERLLNAIRPKPALPYRPMRRGWYEKHFSKWGDVQVVGHAVPSSWFDRSIPESNGLARVAWSTIAWIEKHHPKIASRLGCYVAICATHRAEQPRVRR